MSRPIVKMDIPHLPPHKCFKCGADHTSPRQWFVDTGMEAEFEGIIFLCNNCVLDLALAVGFFSKEKVDELLGIQSSQVLKLLEINKQLTHWGELWEKLSGKNLEDFFINLERVAKNDGSSSGTAINTARTAKPNHLSIS